MKWRRTSSPKMLPSHFGYVILGKKAKKKETSLDQMNNTSGLHQRNVFKDIYIQKSELVSFSHACYWIGSYVRYMYKYDPFQELYGSPVVVAKGTHECFPHAMHVMMMVVCCLFWLLLACEVFTKSPLLLVY